MEIVDLRSPHLQAALADAQDAIRQAYPREKLAHLAERYCRHLIQQTGVAADTREPLFFYAYTLVHRYLTTLLPCRWLLRRNPALLSEAAPLRLSSELNPMDDLPELAAYGLYFWLSRRGVALSVANISADGALLLRLSHKRLLYRKLFRHRHRQLLLDSKLENIHKKLYAVLPFEPLSSLRLTGYKLWDALLGRPKTLRGERSIAIHTPDAARQWGEFVMQYVQDSYRDSRHCLLRQLRFGQFRQLYLCDLMVPESGLLAYLAREQGQPVTLLPHSSTPWYSALWGRLGVTRYLAMTQSAATRIRAAVPDAAITLTADLLGIDRLHLPAFQADAPLTLVIVGNKIGSFHQRVAPHVHRATLARLLTLPEGWQGRVTVIVKPKPSEDASFYQPHLKNPAVTLSRQRLSDIADANQIYVCVNIPSSAMYEAVAAGKPVLFVKDDAYEEHIPVENAPFPRLHSRDFWGRLEAYTQPEAYAKAVQEQQDWLQAELAGAVSLREALNIA